MRGFNGFKSGENTGEFIRELTNTESSQIVRAVNGGILKFNIHREVVSVDFLSLELAEFLGYETEELEKMLKNDKLFFIHKSDKQRIAEALSKSMCAGKGASILAKVHKKDGELNWCNINASIFKINEDFAELYLVFNRVPDEVRLFQNIASDVADEIYVIDKENYNLLYVNEMQNTLDNSTCYIGEKCYKVLYGKDEPCSFCTLRNSDLEGIAHQMLLVDNGRAYKTKFWDIEWNGTPAFVKYVRDITKDIELQKEKDNPEKYFQTVLKHLPSGIAVVRYERDGQMHPEFLSDGFAEMVRMSKKDVWELYEKDALKGVHPDDRALLRKRIEECISTGKQRYEMIYRLRKGEKGYFWVKGTFSVISNEDKGTKVYVDYSDITEERDAKEHLYKQYEELLLHHYKNMCDNILILGHCNITQNRILEIRDNTDSKLLETFGYKRDAFFEGISMFIESEEQRKRFLDIYMNESVIRAFERNENEIKTVCFIKLPEEDVGRHVQVKVNLVETPETGDVIGILTVTDITEKIVSDSILQKLSVTNYDLVIDIDICKKRYAIFNGSREDKMRREKSFKNIEYLMHDHIVSRERAHVEKMLNPDYIISRLSKEDSYSFSYSIEDKHGDILTKNLTVSAVDLRLGRICVARTDITDSVREQQGLLNMIAYTFELACFVDINTKVLTMHTRKTVLKNFPPYTLMDYDTRMERFAKEFCVGNNCEETAKLFTLDVMISRLVKSPSGYDFVIPYKGNDRLRYKQINVLWGDESHKTICLVRADVTDVLSAERQAKNTLKKALTQAEEANKAKSDFLSTMSHDIRTPMNAIMGMTTLAMAHMDDVDKVKEYLTKISISSKHLLSLINDILDMSKIERSKITLKYAHISIMDLVEQIRFIMAPQVMDAGLDFKVDVENVKNMFFFGDELRITQILINLLSNAVKFTPEGGLITFIVEEIPLKCEENKVKYRFKVKDTGIGMTKKFQDRLFEPFSRGANAEKIEGTGLGLSIAKGLVDLMKGSIKVYSREGQGSLFEVKLKCDRASEMEKESNKQIVFSDNEEKDLRGRNFLIVEDNVINSEIICELLQMHGASYVVKTDGLQAVEEFRNSETGRYDAILMDIQMPVMNGFDATRTIRALERADAETIPIVAMTANAFSEDVQASFDAGMNAHVAKPINMKEFCEVLSELLYK